MQFLTNKYVIRSGVSIIIWLFFHIATAKDLQEMATFDLPSLVYLVSTLMITLIAFEILDWVKRSMLAKYKSDFGNPLNLVKFSLLGFVLSTISLTPWIYALKFYIEPFLNCGSPETAWADFTKNMIFSIFFVLVIIASYIIKYFYDRQKQMTLIQAQLNEENIRFKYNSIKSQLNPHFLFNSFSVLTSLVYRNPDIATDFIAQLSKIYRYVPENKDKDLISLKKEIDFIHSYLFLMKIRHEEGIEVEITGTEGSEEFLIPTLSLQLLVENAIKHNGFSEDEPLLLRLYREGSTHFVVENNINTRKTAPSTGTKTGLDNIVNRYTLLGEEKPEIIHTEERFLVRLPLIQMTAHYEHIDR